MVVCEGLSPSLGAKSSGREFEPLHGHHKYAVVVQLLERLPSKQVVAS